MALSPTSSRGGGTFNGGTITEPLIIDLSADVASRRALRVIEPEAFDFSVDAFTFEVANQFALLRFTPQGAVSAAGNSLTSAGGGIYTAGGVLRANKSNNSGSFQVTPSTGDLITQPPASEASSLALGVAYQHSVIHNVLLLVCLNVTVNTSGVLQLGVGPTVTPTQASIISGVTTTGQWNIPIWLPANYYALLSTTGTITVAVDGQLAMPI